MAKRTRPKKICIICGEYKKHRAYGMCNKCYSKMGMKPRKICVICGKYKETHARGMCHQCYRRARKPLNKKSGTYFGCEVAEKVLSKVFKDVKVMPSCNPGFDFICNKGKRIDVKSSCSRKDSNRWSFKTRKNTTADFFLCLAFDNRKSLVPLHLWLIPSEDVKDKNSMSIRESTLSKWDKYKLDISETLQCCDEMKKHYIRLDFNDFKEYSSE